MRNETAVLLWSIDWILQADKVSGSRERSTSERLFALQVALGALIAGYDFEEKK